MKPRAAVAPAPGIAALRIRAVGAACLIALAMLTALGAPWTGRLQNAWFDAYQTLAPREPRELPATIVQIDQKSLLAVGQWPWPRNVLATLVQRIHRGGPAAIGVNILMPEADAMSPEHLLDNAPIANRALRDLLLALPSNDSALAAALTEASAVLVVAGMPERTDILLRATPVVLRGAALPATASSPFVTHAGVLTSLDELDRAAAGRGLVSAESTRGVLRRIPLLASVDGTLLPTLAVEMLRIASGAPALGVSLSGNAVTDVSIGTLKIPTASDATVRLYFSPPRADRFVSAVDVLNGAFDPLRLKGQLVLIGLTGIGSHDYQDTPIGARLSGSEIQVQLLENLVEGSLLRRPAWAAGAEALLLLALGAALLWAAPRWKVLYSSLLLAAAVLAPVGIGFALFRSERWLFDAATPGLSLVLLFGVLLALTLAETSRQRRTLEGMVQQQREHSARMSGELLAAQRIQSDTLPRADLLRNEPRIELHATLSSAREVGGDIYDYFMLDPHRLFLLVGDVAGKGLSASIFMAVSKALYKNAMLRAPDADIGEIMRVANVEVSRDNADMLFVTVFAAILDLRSGELSYCNAGHDNPYRLIDHEPWLQRIEDGDGPPLCAAPDFPYHGARCTLAPGEMLCLMTDGVSEAQNLGGDLYGTARAQQWLLDAARRGDSARQLVEDLRRDVERFSAGAEAADDLTILALRWNGAGEGTLAAAGGDDAADGRWPDPMSDRAQRSFAARIDSLGEAGDFVEQFCADRHIADGDMLRLKLVVEELFTNTAAYGGDDTATVRIELSASDQSIALLYEDSAAPFDPIAHPEPASLDAPLHLRPVGGLGIHLVVQMSQDIRYAREEPFNRLWLQLRRAG